MLAKEAGTRSGEQIEDLHGMRVATRRMRAAWRVFGDGFRPGRTSSLRDRLRVVAGRLGAVRDLDVLLEAAATHQAGLPPADAAAFEPLVAAWRTSARRPGSSCSTSSTARPTSGSSRTTGPSWSPRARRPWRRRAR